MTWGGACQGLSIVPLSWGHGSLASAVSHSGLQGPPNLLLVTWLPDLTASGQDIGFEP